MKNNDTKDKVTSEKILTPFCLICEGIAIGRMLYDVINVQKEVIRKIDKIIAKEERILCNGSNQ